MASSNHISNSDNTHISSHTINSNVNCHLRNYTINSHGNSNNKQEVEIIIGMLNLLRKPISHLCRYLLITVNNRLIWYTSPMATQSMRMTTARNTRCPTSNSRSNSKSMRAIPNRLARQAHLYTNLKTSPIDCFYLARVFPASAKTFTCGSVNPLNFIDFAYHHACYIYIMDPAITSVLHMGWKKLR